MPSQKHLIICTCVSNLSGNIPNHVFYGSIMSEFLRISRCTLRYEDFLPSAISLFRRMINQGGSKIQILKQISKGVKFNKNAKQIREDISKGNS